MPIILKLGFIHLLLATTTMSTYKLLTEDLDGFRLFFVFQGAYMIVYLTSLILIDYVKGKHDG